ncbi:MAG: NADH-ubiquinone oxidoreductase-F iron-sulfur binding region domain-containing protein, partial [Raoultibacter sp.]
MTKLSIAPKADADARIIEYVGKYARRVETTPPGICPLVVQLSLLREGAAQTCGKCVPCRDGLPQLAALLERVVACDADESVLTSLKTLAEMICATSDCAIGYEAANAVLEGLDVFD